MRVAVVGETPSGAALALAADLSLKFGAVAYALLPGQTAPALASASGGVKVVGAAETVSGREGHVEAPVAVEVAEAVAGAELVILNCSANDVESAFATLLPWLDRGQTVHVNLHSYWNALRIAPLLAAADRRDVTITEATAPLCAHVWEGGNVRALALRRNLQVAAFPASRMPTAIATVQAVYPSLRPAANVMETSLANLNMLVHPAIALLNVGWFDRHGGEGGTPFYQQGMTAHVEQLALAQDEERRIVCDAFGVGWIDVATVLRETYGAPLGSLAQTVAGCPYYAVLPPYGASIWRDWTALDVTYAIAGLIQASRLAGVPTPLHEGFGALFRPLLPELIPPRFIVTAMAAAGDLPRLAKFVLHGTL